MKNDPNWLLGNYCPFGEGLLLGVMASCWFQGGYRSISRIVTQVFGSGPKLSGISRRKNAKKKEAKNGWISGWTIHTPGDFFVEILKNTFWLVVSTHFKHISQIGNLPQAGVQIKNI